uniref:Alcohol dehydrogenase-like C-terminal domain-containing protein n=1 Tax=Moniliophthora roreri TaxID=221103 RepID=A0A0W0F7L7_MONRR
MPSGPIHLYSLAMPNFALPKTQKAAVVGGIGVTIQFKTPCQEPGRACPSRMSCQNGSFTSFAGACHTDLHAADGDRPFSPKTPLIGSREGLGDWVGIKWLANSNTSFLGVNHATLIPEGLESNEAAPIPCTAIKYSETSQGDRIVLPGAGGGLGHPAVQYARARGLRVIAIDTSKEKRDLCLKLGAEKSIDLKETKNIVQEVISITGSGPHPAVVTSPASSGYTHALEYLRPGGTLTVVKPNSMHPFSSVSRSQKILGSYVGNCQDAAETLDLAACGPVKVHYKVKPPSHLTMFTGAFSSNDVLTFEPLAEYTKASKLVLLPVLPLTFPASEGENARSRVN